ncbi:tRNA (N(6)-L-threonylcarbamoyladenosine(37)-C(2))-methylthiotransferase MtaB [Bryobacter aggregatus]|uniref:tRNA (N(6)-L-threonylcarbamoyladenosine(37)-C(2))- methylthiotransferase MtaB n=1 Tax=Bryobacter aggregatus TaxID=360054 RepID=UPI0004E0B9C2|nr:tRNA (N(6)-L-threonylcarbamoyladenosine(37)-C(2))-methylthiotransferase MtaB [Bryobacter aggregatus]
MKSFFVQNFGCRASQADGAALEASLAETGLSAAQAADVAGLVVLNTCTVTANADLDLRQAVRRVRRENPAAKILVTGCYAQRSPAEIAALEGVHWVVGNSHKAQIAEIVSSTPYHAEIHVGDISAQSEFFSGPAADRARPNLKIQDGCNNRCSFCIIPSVRGKSRSADANWVIAETKRLAEAGYPEIVLTGINLGRWGRERGEGRLLPDLLQRMLDDTGIRLIRLSSVEPMDFSPRLLELMAGSDRIAKHVHAPLQSGSDTVLRRMYRKYRPKHYEERLRIARQLMPDAAIGADVMVGFPGETEEEFRESAAFIERMPFTYLHVFTYSERPGTEATGMGGMVPMEQRRERNRVLQEISERKGMEFRRRLVGKRFPAVALNNGTTALTTNYVRVDLARPRPPKQWMEVELGALSERGMQEANAFLVLA